MSESVPTDAGKNVQPVYLGGGLPMPEKVEDISRTLSNGISAPENSLAVKKTQ